MSIVVVGLSHKTSPVELRERYAIAETDVPRALQSLRSNGLADEAVILSTCNRVEVYAVATGDPAVACRRLRQQIATTCGQPEPVGDHFYSLHEPQSVHHLFKVACGLDSMVLGETEILGQLKKSYDIALKAGHTGARLNKAFQRAFNTAKQIRTETNIQRGSISIASVAVELAEKIFNSLEGHEVMVIGAGDTSEKTARALLSRGAKQVVVANRSPERAQALASELNGRAVRFDEMQRELERVDIAISSTSAPTYVLNRANIEPLMRARRNRPLLLIDIAVPRDIDPVVNDLDNIYLYNVDDLQTIADDYLEQRREEVARCETIIEQKAAPLLANQPACPAQGRNLTDYSRA